MAILTNAQNATLHAYIVANPSLTDSQIFDAIYAPTAVANPTPQGNVLATLTGPGLLACLTQQTSIQAIETFPAISTLFDDINAQNRVAVGDASALLLASGRIIQSEFTAIMTALAATVPDPNYQATIPGPCWAQTNLGCLGSTVWIDLDGSTHDFVPLNGIKEARS